MFFLEASVHTYIHTAENFSIEVFSASCKNESAVLGWRGVKVRVLCGGRAKYYQQTNVNIERSKGDLVCTFIISAVPFHNISPSEFFLFRNYYFIYHDLHNIARIWFNVHVKIVVFYGNFRIKILRKARMTKLKLETHTLSFIFKYSECHYTQNVYCFF